MLMKIFGAPFKLGDSPVDAENPTINPEQGGEDPIAVTNSNAYHSL